MTVVLDAGALIAYERGHVAVGAALRYAERRAVAVVSSAAAVAQVLRSPARQVSLSRLLDGVDVRPLTVDDAPVVGQLLARTGASDAVDGHIAVLVADGGSVLTSDPDDVRRLLDARSCRASVVRV